MIQLTVFISIANLSAQSTVTTEVQMRSAITELTEATKVLFQNTNVRNEIFYLSKNSLYYDRYVGLSDLMTPQSSQLYAKATVPSQYIGAFRSAMTTLINSDSRSYPNISQFFTPKSTELGANYSFFSKANLYFYVPYVDSYSITNFDPVLVPALEDTNVATGYIKSRDGLSYVTIKGIDDDYAEANPTVIITPETFENIKEKGENPPNFGPGDPSTCCVAHACCEANIRQVHAGWGKLRTQFDSFISVNGNGGGSEMRWLRVFGTLTTLPNGDIVAGASASGQGRDYSRSEIKHKDWKWWGGTWNPDWDCDEVSNLMVVYEQDNEGSVTLNGNVSAKFTSSTGANINVGQGPTNNGTSATGVTATHTNGNEWLASIGFSSTWTSKDEIIVQDTREEDEFFVINTVDQGCGMRNGQGLYNGKNHPVYNCGETHFWYNLPNRCVQRY